MKKSLFFSLLPLSIIFSFSCTFLSNPEITSGSISFSLPGSDNSRTAENGNQELPGEYKVEIFSSKISFNQTETYAAGSTVLIENLRPQTYEITITGQGLHFSYKGNTEAKVKPNKETKATIQLSRFFNPVYVKNPLDSEIGNGTESNPFSSINKAIELINKFGGKGTVYVDGSFNEPIKLSPENDLLIAKNSKAEKAEIESPDGTLSMENGSLELIDIDLSKTGIILLPQCEFKIGGTTKIKETTLQDQAVIRISKPLTSQIVTKINTSKGSPVQVITADNKSVNLATEYTKFTLPFMPNNNKRITSSGILKNNIPIKLTLNHTETNTTYKYEIKEKDRTELLIKSTPYTEPGTSDFIKKDCRTYYFTPEKSYIIYVYKNDQPIPIITKEITVADDIEFSDLKLDARTLLTVQTAISVMKQNPTQKHDLLVSIASNEDFKTLGSGINTLVEDGTADIECVIGSNVTSIPASAFAGCGTKLNNINIPEGITAIEQNAFNGDSVLTALELPSTLKTIGDSAFENCTGITSLNLSNNTQLTSIGTNAFKGTGITTLTVPDSVTTLSDTGITELNIPCTLSIAGNTTVKTLTVRTTSNSTTIPSSAYNGCSALTSVDLPSGLRAIGSSVFDGCAKLTSLEIPNSVTSLGDTLSGSSITTLTTPSQLSFSVITDHDSHGNSIASGNTNLITVHIKDGSSGIPACGYKSCTNLKNLTLEEGITSIGHEAFSKCNSLTGTLTIPNSISTIENGTFYECKNLDFTLHSGLTIGDYAFCRTGINMTSIPANSTIGKGAFKECEKLTSITIPSSVTINGTEAFYDSSVTFAKINCSTIPTDTFSNSSLSSLSLGENVNKMGPNSFVNCNFTSVDYDSTKNYYAYWYALDSKGEYYNNVYIYSENEYNGWDQGPAPKDYNLDYFVPHQNYPLKLHEKVPFQ